MNSKLLALWNIYSRFRSLNQVFSFLNMKFLIIFWRSLYSKGIYQLFIILMRQEWLNNGLLIVFDCKQENIPQYLIGFDNACCLFILHIDLNGLKWIQMVTAERLMKLFLLVGRLFHTFDDHWVACRNLRVNVGLVELGELDFDAVLVDDFIVFSWTWSLVWLCCRWRDETLADFWI